MSPENLSPEGELGALEGLAATGTALEMGVTTTALDTTGGATYTDDGAGAGV